MDKQISKATWGDCCKSYTFVDCEIDKSNRIYLLAQNEPASQSSMEKQSAAGNNTENTRLFLLSDINNSEYLQCLSLSFNQLVAPILGLSSASAFVLSRDKQGKLYTVAPEQLLSQENPQTDFVTSGQNFHASKIRTIDSYPWIVGVNRSVYRYSGFNMWVNSDDGFSGSKKDPDFFNDRLTPSENGFSDIAGFSSEDVYVAGGNADIWHFNGNNWNPCDFPTDEHIDAICCATEGELFVTTQYSLWRGIRKGYQWELVTEFDRPYPANDMCYFDNKIWICFDDGILMWDGTKLHNKVTYNNGVLPLSGSMATNQQQLVIANPYSVWSYDGYQWNENIPMYNLQSLLGDFLK